MEESNKNLYEAPAITVVELKMEGFICLSGDLDGYGDAIEI